jgi:hypothetical protein
MPEFTPVSLPPEANGNFRRGQLLLLLSMLSDPLPVDRIGYLEFFAANPHLVVTDRDAVRLELAGFHPDALSYQSAPERYANRRARLRSDLAALTAWGYAKPRLIDGRIACGVTPQGRRAASGLTSLYADAYRRSVEMLRPFFRLSDQALARQANQWLHISDESRIDLLDLEPGQLSSHENGAR